jgi:hypothetical protein
MARIRLIAVVLFAALALNTDYARGQSQAAGQKRSRTERVPFFFGTAPNLPVFGGGTAGQLTTWTGLGASNSLIGDR